MRILVPDPTTIIVSRSLLDSSSIAITAEGLEVPTIGPSDYVVAYRSRDLSESVSHEAHTFGLSNIDSGGTSGKVTLPVHGWLYRSCNALDALPPMFSLGKTPLWAKLIADPWFWEAEIDLPYVAAALNQFLRLHHLRGIYGRTILERGGGIIWNCLQWIRSGSHMAFERAGAQNTFEDVTKWAAELAREQGRKFRRRFPDLGLANEQSLRNPIAVLEAMAQFWAGARVFHDLGPIDPLRLSSGETEHLNRLFTQGKIRALQASLATARLAFIGDPPDCNPEDWSISPAQLPQCV